MKKMNQYVLSTVLALGLLATAPAGFANAPESLKPLPVHTSTTRNIVDALAKRHYVNTTLDDDLSAAILDGYLEDLDPTRSYFLTSDIAEFEQYRDQLDNALRRGDLDPAFAIFNRYHERVVARFEKVIAMLEDGIDQFDFTRDESLQLDREEAPWAATTEELDELWRKRIKHSVLNLKLADKEPDKIKELLLKRYNNRLSRTLQTNAEDVYQLYMNSFTRTYDPHTQYFSPRTSENFNINMSLSLEGIGAVLQREDEYTKVVSLVPEGPADKSKQIKPNDKIIGVGQGKDGELVDVIGWRLDEVVQLIRGKKNSVVRLDVVPANATDHTESKVIQITRNTVKLEEQSAKSEILEIEQFGHTHKIGVIEIPTFYIDFRALQQGDRDYKSTTRDVTRLLAELMEEGVEGVVIDLRDNGGGSLQEAKTLTGLFIDRGPTVQIRSKSNRVDILNDRDIRTIYDGPLAVLVNRLSASASEIFAGAIQDYERGLIIGNQTFGKGTVQSLLPLNRGQLKLTQAKFYRISGDSTQHRGIIPDISLPANYDPEAIGESTLQGPLPWDEIDATNYRTKYSVSNVLPELRALHRQRATTDPEFAYMETAIKYRRERADRNYITLNEQKRIQDKEEEDAFWLSLENTKRVAMGLKPVESLDALDEEDDMVASTGGAGAPGITSASTEKSEGSDEDGENLQGNEMAGLIEESDSESSDDGNPKNPHDNGRDDVYLEETGHILMDFISISNRTAEKRAGTTI